MKRALFAGTFDPPTLGHLDLIERSSWLCDELIIGIAINPAKQDTFTTEERIGMLKMIAHSLSNVIVVTFSGLTADFAKEHQISFLIRGIRSLTDLDREFQLAIMNKKLSGLETIFLPGNPLHAHISSSLIRELGFNQASLEGLVPPSLEEKILQRFKNKGKEIT